MARYSGLDISTRRRANFHGGQIKYDRMADAFLPKSQADPCYGHWAERQFWASDFSKLPAQCLVPEKVKIQPWRYASHKCYCKVADIEINIVFVVNPIPK